MYREVFHGAGRLSPPDFNEDVVVRIAESGSGIILISDRIREGSYLRDAPGSEAARQNGEQRQQEN